MDSLRGNINTLHDVCAVHRRMFSTQGDIISTVGDIISTVGDIISTVGDTMSTPVDIMSTVGRYHEYTGEILKMVGLLGEKLTFFNSLGTTNIFRSLKRSVYINIVLLIHFPEQFESCFYFKYSRSFKVL